MTKLPIYVYGDGGAYREYFNAIAAFFGASTFNSLLNMAVLLALVTVIYTFSMKRNLFDIIKWLGWFYVAMYISFVPKTTVIIIDRVNNSIGYTVDNIPFGLAVLASYTSSIDDALTQSLESNFTMPDYMPYHKTGMVFASRLVTESNQFEITDSIFDANLQEFVHQCIFYDILLNKYSLNDLLAQSNVWQYIVGYASPARAFIYNGSIVTCKDGARKLTADWKSVIEKAAQEYGRRIYPNVAKEQVKSKLFADLPTSYRFLTNLSDQAQNIMQQNLMANALQRGVISLDGKLDAQAALESYAFTRAQEQKRLTNQTMGEMAAVWLVKIKVVAEVLIYALFIFVVILSVFPFGSLIFKNYAYSLLWIHLWAPCYAIINLLISYHAKVNTVAASEGGLTLKAFSGITQINSDMAGLAGYISILVPVIITGVVSGLYRVMPQLSQYVGGAMQTASSASATEAVTGNFSLGNTSLGNHNASNTSANHVDTSGRVSSGSLASQIAGGSSLTTTASGSTVMDMRGAMSNLATSVNFAESLRSSFGQQADRSYTAAQNEANAYSQSTNAAIRDMYDLSHHLGKSSSSSDNSSISTTSGVSQAVNENVGLTQDYAARHNLSFHDAANVLASAYVDGKVSGSFGANFGGKGVSPLGGGINLGGSVGMSRSASHTSGVDKGSAYSDAQSYVHNTNYGKNVDYVERAVKDHSFRTSDEAGKRLVDSMNTSFDKAESARHDMQSSLQSAESAREMASYTQEHANSIQINGTQGLRQYIAAQPGTNGTGRIGPAQVESIQNDPHLASYYANQYMEQYKHEVESNWNHGLAANKHDIQSKFQGNNTHVQDRETAASFNEKNKAELIHKSSAAGLENSHTLDTSAVSQANQILSDNKHHIDSRHDEISKNVDQHQKTVENEETRKRHGGLVRDLTHDIDTKEHV